MPLALALNYAAIAIIAAIAINAANNAAIAINAANNAANYAAIAINGAEPMPLSPLSPSMALNNGAIAINAAIAIVGTTMPLSPSMALTMPLPLSSPMTSLWGGQRPRKTYTVGRHFRYAALPPHSNDFRPVTGILRNVTVAAATVTFRISNSIT